MLGRSDWRGALRGPSRSCYTLWVACDLDAHTRFERVAAGSSSAELSSSNTG